MKVVQPYSNSSSANLSKDIRKKRKPIYDMLDGMDSIQYILSFMDHAEAAGEDTLLYIVNHLRFMQNKSVGEPARKELFKASITFVESLLNEVYMEMEEVERLAVEHAKSLEKTFYIIDTSTMTGDDKKEYWTLTTIKPTRFYNGPEVAPLGTCNEYGFTDKMPDMYKHLESLNVCFGYTLRHNHCDFKGETTKVSGQPAAVIKLFPHLCKPKGNKLDLLPSPPVIKEETRELETVAPCK